MAFDFSLQLNPRRRSAPLARVDPACPDRLLVSHRGGVWMRLAGLLVVLLATAMFLGGSQQPAFSVRLVAVCLAMAGGMVVLWRRRQIYDRRRNTLEHSLGAPLELSRSTRELDVERVVVEEETSVDTDSDGYTSYHTTFPVVLRSRQGPVRLEALATWESAVDLAETFARFFEVELSDEVRGTTESARDLDLSLREQRGRGSLRACAAGEPPATRSRLEPREAGGFTLTIPRPGKVALAPLSVLTGLVAVFFALPVTVLMLFDDRSSDPLWMAWLPVLIVVSAAIKTSFGYSATVDASHDALRVTTRGLLFQSTVVIPAEELEALRLHVPEHGGPREVLRWVFDGVLVARSDRSSVRFGHGLSFAELSWLRSELVEELSVPFEAHSLYGERRKSASLPGSALPMLGCAAGALLGNLVGGPLGVCLAAPVLEHVLNVGALVGLLAASMIVAELRRAPPALSTTGFVFGSLGLLAIVAFLLDPASPVVAATTQYDESSFVQLTLEHTPLLRHAAWTPLFAAGGGLAGSILSKILLLGMRRVKTRRA